MFDKKEYDRKYYEKKRYKKRYDSVKQRDISFNAFKIDDETGKVLSIIYYNAQPLSSAIDSGNFDSRDLLPTYINSELNLNEYEPGRKDYIGNEYDDKYILYFLINKRKQLDKRYAK